MVIDFDVSLPADPARWAYGQAPGSPSSMAYLQAAVL